MTTRALDEIREILTTNAQPARAAPMRAYMRDQFMFLGIPTPLRRSLLNECFRALKGSGATYLMGLAKQLWALSEREYQYAALDMLAMRHKELSVEQIPELLLLAQDKSHSITHNSVLQCAHLA